MPLYIVQINHSLTGESYVSGRPEQPKERAPIMNSTTMPYLGVGKSKFKLAESGLRALVKNGYVAPVTSYVDDSAVISVNSSNKDVSSEFIKWLRERNLSMVDQAMRPKEGYIKEGSIVSVMGVIQRNNNMLLIVPPAETVSTGYLWPQCVFPSSLDGIVIRCEDICDADVMPV